jgi:hypothetical protein
MIWLHCYDCGMTFAYSGFIALQHEHPLAKTHVCDGCRSDSTEGNRHAGWCPAGQLATMRSMLQNAKESLTIRDLKAQAAQLLTQVKCLIGECDFVLSGGDDPHDRCTDCGCAGYGMLRDELHRAYALVKRLDPATPERTAQNRKSDDADR